MHQPQKVRCRKPVQLEFPWPRQGQRQMDGRYVAEAIASPTGKRLRADNQDDPFASGTYPTRGVFKGHDVRKKPAKFRGSLTLLDFAKRVGPGPESADCYGA